VGDSDQRGCAAGVRRRSGCQETVSGRCVEVMSPQEQQAKDARHSLFVFRALANFLDRLTRLLGEPHQEDERGDSLCLPPFEQSRADHADEHRCRHVPAGQRACRVIAQRLATELVRQASF
jgi:hypothetical protein